MEITDIKTQAKDCDRVNVYVDGEFYCGLEKFTLALSRLSVGSLISKDELDEIITESEGAKAFDKSIKLISKRFRTTSEIRRYLREKEYNEITIENTIDKLSEYGYIDDERFVESYIASYPDYGILKLRQNFQRFGLDKNLIDETLANLGSQEEPAYDVAVRLLRRSDMDRNRLTRLLYSRGFVWSTISGVIATLIEEGELE